MHIFLEDIQIVHPYFILSFINPNLFLLRQDRRTPAHSLPITLLIASTLSLRNSRASIMGSYSPYLGDLNGFSSLNPSSSLMAFCTEVLTLFTADPLRPAMGNVAFCREIRSPHNKNWYTQFVSHAFSSTLFLFPLCSPSLYLAPSLKHTCTFIFIPVQTLA